MLSVTVHIHGMIAAHVGCDRTHQNQSDVNSTLRWICNLLRSRSSITTAEYCLFVVYPEPISDWEKLHCFAELYN